MIHKDCPTCGQPLDAKAIRKQEIQNKNDEKFFRFMFGCFFPIIAAGMGIAIFGSRDIVLVLFALIIVGIGMILFVSRVVQFVKQADKELRDEGLHDVKFTL